MKNSRGPKKAGSRRSPKSRFIVGTLEVNPAGFGFILPKRAGFPDVYVAEEDMGDAIHGDVVKAIVYKNRQKNKLYGKVKKVLSRNTSEITGLVRRENEVLTLVPLNRRYNFTLLLPDDADLDDGTVVVASIKKYPRFPFPGEGKAIKVLGNENDPAVRILALMEEYKISCDFPEDVLAEAEKVREMPPFYASFDEREDLRDEIAVTIDPSDAKDFDDALSVKRSGDGWTVMVHIADVAEYVRPGGSIDIEARDRSFSVYLVDRAVPMLPHQLSSDLCSLVEGKDRLCLTVKMTLDRRGDLLKYEITPSVIRVRKRLTYDEVQEALDDKKTLGKELDNTVALLAAVAKVLYEKRKKAGMIEFDFPEAKVELDDEGRAINVKVIERVFAYRIVEHLMILTNSVIAEYLFKSDALAIYRVHEKPSSEKLMELKDMLSSLGIELKRIGQSNKAINRLLKQVEGLPCKRLVQGLVLRSLPRARYDVRCLGHFGLALRYYLHFTSPIRRYPDLTVHRMVHALIAKDHEMLGQFDLQELSAVATYASAMEERVDEVEMTSVKIKMVEYMANKIGEVFEGVISWVTPRGLFAELANTVEGFVPLEDLDTYGKFYYDEDSLSLKGSGAKVMRLGDVVKVKLMRVDKSSNQIYFHLLPYGE